MRAEPGERQTRREAGAKQSFRAPTWSASHDRPRLRDPIQGRLRGLARPRLHAAIGRDGSDECINVERTGCPNVTDRELHAFDSQR